LQITVPAKTPTNHDESVEPVHSHQIPHYDSGYEVIDDTANGEVSVIMVPPENHNCAVTHMHEQLCINSGSSAGHSSHEFKKSDGQHVASGGFNTAAATTDSSASCIDSYQKAGLPTINVDDFSRQPPGPLRVDSGGYDTSAATADASASDLDSYQKTNPLSDNVDDYSIQPSGPLHVDSGGSGKDSTVTTDSPASYPDSYQKAGPLACKVDDFYEQPPGHPYADSGGSDTLCDCTGTTVATDTSGSLINNCNMAGWPASKFEAFDGIREEPGIPYPSAGELSVALDNRDITMGSSSTTLPTFPLLAMSEDTANSQLVEKDEKTSSSSLSSSDYAKVEVDCKGFEVIADVPAAEPADGDLRGL
jgi:hypothetical protein